MAKSKRGTKHELEDRIEERGNQLAKARGYLCIKMNTAGRRNLSDRQYLGPNARAIWVEWKRLGERPTPGQAFWLQQLQERGHEAYILDNTEAFEEILKNHKTSNTCAKHAAAARALATQALGTG